MNKEELSQALGGIYGGFSCEIENVINAFEKLQQENKELHNKIDKLTNNLENSIESINAKLGDKEIRVKDGRIVNLMSEFRSVRLKAIRMKCKELLEIIKGSDVDG